jgi:hypothetical protein
MSQLRRLPVESLSGEPCSDGSAIISEIACGPGGEAWPWQLTLILMGQEVDFPAHTDLRRQFVALDAAADIIFPGGRLQHLSRLQVARFDHDNDPDTCVPESPTRTLNLKLRGDTKGELIARPLNGAMVLLAPIGWHWLLMLMTGHAKIIADHVSQEMAPNEMMWIDPIPGHPVRIEGGGEIVLARLPAP